MASKLKFTNVHVASLDTYYGHAVSHRKIDQTNLPAPVSGTEKTIGISCYRGRSIDRSFRSVSIRDSRGENLGRRKRSERAIATVRIGATCRVTSRHVTSRHVTSNGSAGTNLASGVPRVAPYDRDKSTTDPSVT